MAESLKELYDARAKATHDARQILDRADSAKRDLTSDELTNYNRIDREIDELSDKIHKREQSAAALRRQVAPLRTPGNDGASLEIGYEGYNIPGMLRGRSPRQTVLRAGSNEALRASDSYRNTFLAYLKAEATRERLGLQTSKDPKGGYLAPMQFVANLIKFLDDAVFMRQLSTVLPPLSSAVSIGVPSWDSDPGDADWTAEVPASDISEDDSATLGTREMMPHLLTKLVKLGLKLMRSAAINAESLLTDRLGYKFAVSEEKAFLTGSGNKQPLGIFTASSDGISTGRDSTCTGATAFTADELIDAFYTLKGQYQANASWVVSREFARRCRKLKDGNGQYLWQPGLVGMPNTILDRPYFQSEFAPSTFTANQYVAVVGDFKNGYWIADSLEVEIQRLGELFALRNQVGLLGRKETDGAPVLEECFVRLKLGA